MVFIDHMGNVRVKIVMYGPARSGKTTLLKRLAEEVEASWKAKVRSIDDPEGQTLFFDFAPFELVDKPLAVDIFTVPGKYIHLRQREQIVKGADMIIFVGDYSNDRLKDNIESLRELVEVVDKQVPVILAMNKYDLVYRLNKKELEENIPQELEIVYKIDVSAKLNFHVRQLFMKAIELAIKRAKGF